MKKTYILLAGLCLALLAACKDDDYSMYDTPDDRLNFLYYTSDSTVLQSESVTDQMRLRSFSFKLESDADATRDTVWLEAATLGFVTAEARPFVLEQIQVEGVKNAEPGVHYVAFDAPEVQPLYQVAANQNKVRIPVIVLRDDPDLQDTVVVLKLTFKDNGIFRTGFEGLDTRTIQIADFVTQPASWYKKYNANPDYGYEGHGFDNLVGAYGKLKHEKMIEWTGKPWDSDYIDEFYNGDSAYRTYMITFLTKKLEEENADRAKKGLGPLTEKDGTPVDFTGYY